MESLKGKKSRISSVFEEKEAVTDFRTVKRIVYVCDAGMGSSAMASALFKKKLKAEGVSGMEVFHVSADHIPEDADVLVCQKSFASSLPDTGHPCFTVENLADMGGYGKLLNWLKGDE